MTFRLKQVLVSGHITDQVFVSLFADQVRKNFAVLCHLQVSESARHVITCWPEARNVLMKVTAVSGSCSASAFLGAHPLQSANG